MLTPNRCRQRGQPLASEDAAAFSAQSIAAVVKTMRLHPAYHATPLHPLPSLARELGVSSINVKDEAGRFGLGSFKALGGAWAVVQLALAEAEHRLGRKVAPHELLDPEVRASIRGLHVGCATDGNHGKSVAAGANLLGIAATIFVHQGVPRGRAAAIARYGAHIVTVPGTYDDALITADRECRANGWTVVSDWAQPGHETVPRLVMKGYAVMVDELRQQLIHEPTHAFLQAGVGGFAAAVAAAMAVSDAFGETRFIIVEPALAACLFASNARDRPTVVEAGEPTVMTMLECYTPSSLAWDILSRLADAFMTVDEDEATAAVAMLGLQGRRHGIEIASSPSGAAGAAGMMRTMLDGRAREDLHIGTDSRLLVFNTEGPAPSA